MAVPGAIIETWAKGQKRTRTHANSLLLEFLQYYFDTMSASSKVTVALRMERGNVITRPGYTAGPFLRYIVSLAYHNIRLVTPLR